MHWKLYTWLNKLVTRSHSTACTIRVLLKLNVLDWTCQHYRDHKRIPKRFLNEGCQPHNFADPKSRCRQKYYEFIDTAATAIRSRFQQEGFKLRIQIERLLKTALNLKLNGKEEDYDSEDKETTRAGMKKDLDEICLHFQDDLDNKRFLRQLDVLRDACKGKNLETIRDVCSYLNEFRSLHEVFGEIAKLIKLFLVIPATSATAERSFSGMRRLKTYLRSTTTTERLNSIMVLHTHKDMLDEIHDTQTVAEFTARNENRKDIFGTYTIKFFTCTYFCHLQEPNYIFWHLFIYIDCMFICTFVHKLWNWLFIVGCTCICASLYFSRNCWTASWWLLIIMMHFKAKYNGIWAWITRSDWVNDHAGIILNRCRNIQKIIFCISRIEKCDFFIIRNVLQYMDLYCTKCHHFGLKHIEIVGGWGSAPDPTGRAYSAPPDPLAGLCGRGGWGEGKRRGGEGEREGKGRCALQPRSPSAAYAPPSPSPWTLPSPLPSPPPATALPPQSSPINLPPTIFSIQTTSRLRLNSWRQHLLGWCRKTADRHGNNSSSITSRHRCCCIGDHVAAAAAPLPPAAYPCLGCWCRPWHLFYSSFSHRVESQTSIRIASIKGAIFESSNAASLSPGSGKVWACSRLQRMGAVCWWPTESGRNLRKGKGPAGQVEDGAEWTRGDPEMINNI